jgi:hypothetical protein
MAAYLGLAVPVLGLGVATQAFTARTALLGFSAVRAAVIGLVARRLLANRPASCSMRSENRPSYHRQPCTGSSGNHDPFGQKESVIAMKSADRSAKRR